jgi:hypothetical protein
MCEAKLGYPYYWILAVGSVSEAEDEALGKWPLLAEAIRRERTRYMKNRDYVPKMVKLVAIVHEMILALEADEVIRKVAQAAHTKHEKKR